MDINYKIHTNFHSIHSLFLKHRYVALAIFCAIIYLAISRSPQVLGSSIVAEVNTQVKIYFDNQEKTLTTNQNTVEGALSQAGIPLQKNDITKPPLNTLLNGQNQDISVIRALPVLISDNNQEHLAYSAYENESDILKQLNIETFPEDRVSSNLIMDPADENAVGQKVTIVRAPVYTVHVDGNDQIIHSWGTTVGEVIKDKVTLGQRDIVEPSVGVSSGNVREITVTRINFVETEENVAIPYETIIQKDYTTYKGQTKVIQEGENGQKNQKIRIVYHNGQVVDRIILSTEIIINSKARIVGEGVKPYNAGMWWNTIVAAGSTWGVDPLGLYNVMICESGGNPFSGSYYKGLFQYSPDTWAGASASYPGGSYRGAAITDGNAQIYVTAWKVSRGGWSAWGCKP